MAELYAFSVRSPIPSFPLPLQSKDVEPVLDLQYLLNRVYEKASLDLSIDYTVEPVPPLKGDNVVWADALLSEKGLR